MVIGSCSGISSVSISAYHWYIIGVSSVSVSHRIASLSLSASVSVSVYHRYLIAIAMTYHRYRYLIGFGIGIGISSVAHRYLIGIGISSVSHHTILCHIIWVSVSVTYWYLIGISSSSKWNLGAPNSHRNPDIDIATSIRISPSSQGTWVPKTCC